MDLCSPFFFTSLTVNNAIHCKLEHSAVHWEIWCSTHPCCKWCGFYSCNTALVLHTQSMTQQIVRAVANIQTWRQLWQSREKSLRWGRRRGGGKWTLVWIKVQSRSKLRSLIHCFQGVSDSALKHDTLLATTTTRGPSDISSRVCVCSAKSHSCTRYLARVLI